MSDQNESNGSDEPKLSDQIVAYEASTKALDQLISIEKTLVSVSVSYLTITGAVWVAVSAEQISIGAMTSTLLLGIHAVGSLAFLPFIIGLRHAILQRFGFREKMAELYPRIEAFGKAAAHEIYGSTSAGTKRPFKRAINRWGRQDLLWYLLPLFGLGGSIILAISIWIPCMDCAASTKSLHLPYF